MAAKRQSFGDRMAVLKNARHERFAQLIAEGSTQSEAYRLAGYKPNRSDASKLHSNPNIAARVATILADGAERAGVTVETVTEALLRIAQKAEALEDSPGLNTARASWMDAAKLAGLITDKQQTELTERPKVSHEPAETRLERLKVAAAENGHAIH